MPGELYLEAGVAGVAGVVVVDDSVCFGRNYRCNIVLGGVVHSCGTAGIERCY